MKAKCQNPKCKYEWETKSQMIMVSCPSCGSKVKIREVHHLNPMSAVKEYQNIMGMNQNG